MGAFCRLFKRLYFLGRVDMKFQCSQDLSEIIEMAWCDKTSFDDMRSITGLSEAEIIKIMRRHLKPSSFRLWRKRVSGRAAKHLKIYQQQRESTHFDDAIMLCLSRSPERAQK